MKNGYTYYCPYCNAEGFTLNNDAFKCECRVCHREMQVREASNVTNVANVVGSDVASKIVDSFIQDKRVVNEGNPAIEVLKDKNTQLSILLERASLAVANEKIRIQFLKDKMEIELRREKMIMQNIIFFSLGVLAILFIASKMV